MYSEILSCKSNQCLILYSCCVYSREWYFRGRLCLFVDPSSIHNEKQQQKHSIFWAITVYECFWVNYWVGTSQLHFFLWWLHTKTMKKMPVCTQTTRAWGHIWGKLYDCFLIVLIIWKRNHISQMEVNVVPLFRVKPPGGRFDINSLRLVRHICVGNIGRFWLK